MIIRNYHDKNGQKQHRIAIIGILGFLLVSAMGCANVRLQPIPDFRGRPPAEVPQFTTKEQAEIDNFRAEFGSDVLKADNEYGVTLLHLAVGLYKGIDEEAFRHWDIAIAKYLVSKGSVVDAKDKLGYTPLHWAVLYSERAPIGQFLRAEGTSRSLITCDFQIFKNDRFIADLDIYANTEAVKYLISKGADVDTKGIDDMTPLHTAAGWHRGVEIAQILISAGANVNAKTTDGITPLHYAADNGNLEIVKSLVYAGANVNVQRPDGITPLHGAAYRGNVEIAKFLVSSGANVNAKTENAFTPLELAKRGGNTAVIEYLFGIVDQGEQLERDDVNEDEEH